MGDLKLVKLTGGSIFVMKFRTSYKRQDALRPDETPIGRQPEPARDGSYQYVMPFSVANYCLGWGPFT